MIITPNAIKSNYYIPTNKMTVAHQTFQGVHSYEADDIWTPDTDIKKAEVLHMVLSDEPRENIAFDRSRYGNHGTVTGAAWGIQGRTHNGSSHYITTTADPSFANGITALAWVKHTGIGAGNERYVNKNDGATVPFDLLLVGATSRLNFTIGTVTAAGAASAISQDVWHLVGGTYDLSNVRCFLNGVQSGNNAAQTGAPPTNAALITIGARASLAAYFEGIIGEVWLFNRALLALEQQQIHNATKWRYQ